MLIIYLNEYNKITKPYTITTTYPIMKFVIYLNKIIKSFSECILLYTLLFFYFYQYHVSRYV